MLDKIHKLLASARVDLSSEKRTQSDIESLFQDHNIEYEREYRLSSSDIPDFFIDGLVIEIKLKGARKKDIFKQLVRYASHDCVKAVMLVTNLTMGLPEELENKPVYFVSLGKAWL